jgi:hypothetical protein
MPGRPEPVDLLEFVGARGRQYVLPSADEAQPGPEPEPVELVEAPTATATRDRSRRARRAETRAAHRAAARAEHLARAGIVVEPAADAAADHLDLAGDPDTHYVAAIGPGASGGRQRAWLICVLVLALGLPALVVTYGYNRDLDSAEALAAPPTTASTVRDTTSELVSTESTAKKTTTTAAIEETTTSSTEAPTTSVTSAPTSTTAYATSSTTAYAYSAVQAQAAPVVTTPPTTAYVAPTTVYVPPTTAAPAQGEAAFLACVRMRESGGNYGAVSPDGLYRGAYQFHQSTWNNVASMAGRPDLIGVPPNLASPSDQDLLAVTLYRAAGAAPWGGYCA